MVGFNKTARGAGLLLAILFASCAGDTQSSAVFEPINEVIIKDENAPPPNTGDSLAPIKNRIWLLSEVKIAYGSIAVDRAMLQAKHFDDYYSIQFVNEGVSGRAAPNKYFAPYAMVQANNIALRPIVGTLSPPTLTLVDSFTEREYYRYLQNIYRWEWSRGALFLYSMAPSGDEVVLIYVPK